MSTTSPENEEGKSKPDSSQRAPGGGRPQRPMEGFVVYDPEIDGRRRRLRVLGGLPKKKPSP